MAYSFYIDGVLLPIPPSRVNMKITNNNKTVTLINNGEINILKDPGLTDVDFEILLPSVKYPFARYETDFKSPGYFLDKLRDLKNNKKPFQFIVSRLSSSNELIFDTNMKVGLEGYEIKEDAENGFDIVVSINLKQYRDYSTKIIKIPIVETKPSPKPTPPPKPVVQKPPRPTNTAPKVRTHKVVMGDTLWGLARRFYGDGSKYPTIYNANKDKIKNPNLIYVGQVLKIP